MIRKGHDSGYMKKRRFTDGYMEAEIYTTPHGNYKEPSFMANGMHSRNREVM